MQRIRETLLQRVSAERLAQLRGQVDEVTRASSLLADLGNMIALMRLEMQKRNVHPIFERIEFNDVEIERLETKQAAKAAFGTITAALSEPSSMPIMPKVGIEPTFLSLGTRF